MRIHLFKKRLVPFPTVAGCVLLAMLAGIPIAWCGWYGEDFFSVTERQPAEVLVVEGWIGIEGIRAAKTEFEQGKYKYIVTSGGPTNNRWERQQWNYATEAYELLIKLGVPPDCAIEAAAPRAGNHRTFEAASVVRQTLDQRGLHPESINLFTFGTHARRSRLVFAKALHSPVKVGVVSWIPPHFLDGPWWRSSERSIDLLKESVGYIFEVFLNSGRFSNGPAQLKPGVVDNRPGY